MALYSVRLRRSLSLSTSLLHRNLHLDSSRKISTLLLNHSLSRFDAQKSKIPYECFRFFRSSPVTFSTRRQYQGPTDDQEIGPDTILFEGCDYNHWLITIDFPKDEQLTPEQMVETYVQTAAKVFGSVEEAKKKIYACSTTTYQGFQVECSEETSEKFQGIPGVVFVLPDSYIDPVNKEYGGDKYINGTIIPRPPPIQYRNRREPRNQRLGEREQTQGDTRRFDRPPQDNYDSRQGSPPQQNYGPPQQNYGPPQQNYGPPQGPSGRQNYGPPQSAPTPPSYGPPRGPSQQYYSQPQGPPSPQSHGLPQDRPSQQNYGPPQDRPSQQNYGSPQVPSSQQNFSPPPRAPLSQQNYGPPPRAPLSQQNYGPSPRAPPSQQNQGPPPQGPQSQQHYGPPPQGPQSQQHYGPPPQVSPHQQNFGLYSSPPQPNNGPPPQGPQSQQHYGPPPQVYPLQQNVPTTASGGWDRLDGGKSNFHHVDNGYSVQRRFEGQGQSSMPTKGGNFSSGLGETQRQEVGYNQSYASGGIDARFSQSEPRNNIHAGAQVANQEKY